MKEKATASETSTWGTGNLEDRESLHGVMVLGPLGKLLAPIGMVLVLVAVTVTVLAFLFVLMDLTGDFQSRIRLLAGTTSLSLIVGGAVLVWFGK